MTVSMRGMDLRKLNTMTKYPSIPTYHPLDPRNGQLLDGPLVFPDLAVGTEKVDGTNARVILLPDGNYVLGSREELLYARGDLIGNPSQGIVQHLHPVADELVPNGALQRAVGEDVVRVLYLELYGGKIGGQARQYSTKGAVGWRLFDVAIIPNPEEILAWDQGRISEWRDTGGQEFAWEPNLADVAAVTGLELVPRLFIASPGDLPYSIAETRDFLGKHLPASGVVLDDSGKGAAEGIVLRTMDRKVIAKARFADYDRTLKKKAGR